jgi:hypothetical protein
MQHVTGFTNRKEEPAKTFRPGPHTPLGTSVFKFDLPLDALLLSSDGL